MHTNGRTGLALLGLASLIALGAVWWTFLLPDPVHRESSVKKTAGDPVRLHSGLLGVASESPERTAGPNLKEIAAVRNPVQAVALGLARIQGLRPADFPQEWVFLLGQPKGEWRDLMLRQLLRRWGREDPLTAIATVAAPPQIPPAEAAGFADQVLWGWVTEEPEKAWAWALASRSQLPLGRGRGSGAPAARTKSMVDALIESGRFETAASLLAGTTESADASMDDLSTNVLAQQWSRTDTTAAMKWANEMGGSRSKTNIIGAIAYSSAQRDPEAAIRFAASLSEQSTRRLAESNVLLGLSERRDRVIALRWLNEIASDNADGSFDSVLRSYYSLDNFEGVEFQGGAAERAPLARIQYDAGRERAAQQYVDRIRVRSPADAIQAVLEFYPPATREAALVETVAQWAGRDPGAAVIHINGLAGLSDDLRARLLAAANSR